MKLLSNSTEDATAASKPSAKKPGKKKPKPKKTKETKKKETKTKETQNKETKIKDTKVKESTAKNPKQIISIIEKFQSDSKTSSSLTNFRLPELTFSKLLLPPFQP